MAEKLLVKLRADVDDLKRDMAKASTNVKKSGDKMQKSADKIKKSFKGVAAVLAGAFAVKGISSMITKTVDLTDRIAKLSKQVGASVSNIAAYRFIAERSGTTMEGFAGALKRSQRAIGEADQGLGVAKDTFKQLNLNVSELKALSPTQQFEAISESISKLPTQTERATAAMQIFGRSGTDLLPIIQEGADGIEKMRDRFNELTGGLSGDFAAKMEETQDKITDLGFAWEGVKNTLISSGLGDFYNGIIEGATNLLVFFRERIPYIKYVFSETFGGAFSEMKRILSVMADTFSAIWNSIIKPLSAFFWENIVKPFASAVGKVASFLADMGEVFRKVFNYLSTTVIGKFFSAWGKRLDWLWDKIQKIMNAISNVMKKAADLGKSAWFNTLNAIGVVSDETISDLEKMEKVRQRINESRTKVEIEPEIVGIDEGSLMDFKSFQKKFNASIMPDTSSLRTLGGVINNKLAGARGAAGRGNVANDNSVIANDNLNIGLEKTKEKLSEAKTEAGLLEKTLNDAFSKPIKNIDDLKDAGLGALQSIGNELIKMASQNLIGSIFGGSSGGGLGSLLGGGSGGGLGSVISNGISSIFGGFFADGGDPPVGKPSIVGEKGPEVFVPKQAGTIIPNKNLGGGSNTTYNIDARGADAGVEQRIRKAIAESEARTASRVPGIVQAANARGGSMSKTLNNRL